MINSDSISTEDFFIKSLNNIKINKSRAVLLSKIASFISNEVKVGTNTNLNFICTHNSRRSQLAQVWASYATNYFKIENINCFSGGTAVTSFYRNTAKTLQQVGFKFEILKFSHQNPNYSISYKNCSKPIIGYSKLYTNKDNKKPYIAITTCSNADTNCPFIPDAIQRFHLPFNDPKEFDNTKLQAIKYLETNQQIAGEIHFIFKKIKELL